MDEGGHRRGVLELHRPEMERCPERGGGGAAKLGCREWEERSPENGEKGGAAKAVKSAKAAVHVTEVDGRRHRQGDGSWTCVFKDVMGCQGTHPPWHCNVFGKLPVKVWEKIIGDNRLCPFCLLHDKAKPCRAKQRPVACLASNCKGRHIQKLHDFLKDVFKEENQVHVVHRDDGWEESEEACEFGEEEMMIVVTVQQEDDCSWQDASRSWLEQDREEEAGIYKVGAHPGTGGAPLGTGEEAATCPPVRERDDAEATKDGWENPGPDNLLVEGEEGEYFIELLMREAPPGESDPASSKASQAKKKDKKRASKGSSGAATQPEEKGTGLQKGGESAGSQAGKRTKATAPDPLLNTEAKGGGMTGRSQTEAKPGPRSTTTSRGKCSGQEKPDS